MPKFEIELARWVRGPQYATVVVEADNEDDARELVWDEDIDWKSGYMRCDDGVDIESVVELDV